MARLKLNLDEQKNLLLNYLNESNTFFSLKELEKNVSNLKGLQAHNVKTILKTLVDKGLVKQEKIEKTDYYWTINENVLENEEIIDLKNKILEENNKLIDLELEIKNYEKNLDDESKNEHLVNEKMSLEKSLNLENNLKNEELLEEENLKKKKELKEKVNLWTENIFLIKKFIKNKFSFEEKVINKGFGIPNDLDFL